jgi:hypothetical protein
MATGQATRSGPVRGLLSRRLLVGSALVVAVIAALVFGAAYGYARSQQDVIAQGIRVNGVDLGGLSAPAARARLERAFAPLRRPLVLRYPRGRLVVTARALRVRVETAAAVDQALELSRRPWFLPRAWREVTGGKKTANLQLRSGYSGPAVTQVVRGLQRRIDRRPENARLLAGFDHLRVTADRRGVAVAAQLLRRRIAKSLTERTAPRLLSVPLRYPHAPVTVAVLRRRHPSFITIDRAAFTLRLFSHLRFARSYPIAVGQLGLETPAGLYHIQDKVVNPSWQVPFSSWTGSLAGQVIPPGPDDPLKARWLGIFNGAGIHGTDETWSIGHAVSHGCVRMTIPDVIDLYDRVAVGTPVYIGD